MAITVDAVTYAIPVVSLERRFEFLYKYAERLENGNLASEVLGVYRNFDVTLGMSLNNVSDYAALVLVLAAATESHAITFLGVSANYYIANLKDTVVRDGATPYYRNLSFSAICISPTYS